MLLETESPDQFIRFMRENYGRKNRVIPLSRWAEKMGYRSPRSLGMLIEGKRLPSRKMIESLAKDYGLSSLEKRYLELLSLEKRKGVSEQMKNEVRDELNSIRKSKDRLQYQVKFEELNKLKDWYVLTIRQLVGTKGFVECDRWIRKRLRNKVKSEEIQDAIDQLIKVGGLTRDLTTGLLKKSAFSFVNLKDIPNASLRDHHKEMIQRALESIDESGTYERELNSIVFAMNKSQLSALKQKIREFCASISDIDSSSQEADAVYQFNVQLFEHTVEIPEDQSSVQNTLKEG